VGPQREVHEDSYSYRLAPCRTVEWPDSVEGATSWDSTYHQTLFTDGGRVEVIRIVVSGYGGAVGLAQ
jgi:hypothetical protein